MQSWNLLDPDQFRLVLKETLASHLPRIAVRELSLTHNFETRECWELLHLLGSHDALMLKRCRMENNGIYYGGRWRRVQFNLPDRFITQSALLESFSLIGYGLNWEILHGFQSLKTVFLRIPSPFAPSNAQILRFLSRTPLLEQLTIYGICISPDQDGSSLHDAELIHLKSVDISCNREFLPPFFDHLIFPKKFKLDVRSDQTYEIQDVSFTTLQNWLGKIDDAHAGSAARLILDRDRELVFWKPEETQLDSEPVGSSWTLEDGRTKPGCYVHAPYYYPATSPNIVKIHFERFRKNLNEAIFRSLRLDQLVSLVVDSAYLDIEGWALAGGLPRLESLELDGFGYHGFADSDRWMYHPRLPHLQVESLEVDVPGFHEYSDSDQWRTRKTTPVDILCDILRLRTYSELPRLRWLGLVDVSLDDSEGEDLKLDRLEEFADEFNFQLKSKFLYQKSTVMM
ncbi:hypothetical protein H0H92_005180 [Tricholoma furcatifolium]|nr:hypothetical protein H0H92_005180 [Tricholoma furcatifolium]